MTDTNYKMLHIFANFVTREKNPCIYRSWPSTDLNLCCGSFFFVEVDDSVWPWVWNPEFTQTEPESSLCFFFLLEASLVAVFVSFLFRGEHTVSDFTPFSVTKSLTSDLFSLCFSFFTGDWASLSAACSFSEGDIAPCLDFLFLSVGISRTRRLSRSLLFALSTSISRNQKHVLFLRYIGYITGLNMKKYSVSNYQGFISLFWEPYLGNWESFHSLHTSWF